LELIERVIDEAVSPLDLDQNLDADGAAALSNVGDLGETHREVWLGRLTDHGARARHYLLPHSDRKASIGSDRDARAAGTMDAMSATSITRTETAAIVTGSAGSTP
jgi:hypothetical protein